LYWETKTLWETKKKDSDFGRDKKKYENKIILLHGLLVYRVLIELLLSLRALKEPHAG